MDKGPALVPDHSTRQGQGREDPNPALGCPVCEVVEVAVYLTHAPCCPGPQGGVHPTPLLSWCGPPDFIRLSWYWAYMGNQLPRWQAGSSEG